MSMRYEDVQPDRRVICHSRGGTKGTALSKRPDGFGEDKPVVRIAFDNGGEAWNYPEQISPLIEPAAGPKLRSTGFRGTYSFWQGGEEYIVRNSASGARG
jgi:hypothetical protein